MSKEINYTFSAPLGSSIVIMTSDTLTDVPNAGEGYAITGIIGTFNGQQITGLVGTGGQLGFDVEDHPYDNTIFVSNSQGGDGGSTDGIDLYGVEFTTSAGTYNLDTYEGSFSYNVNSGSYSNATVSATNEPEAVCFTTGTLIRTRRGDIAVEDLAVGDMAATAYGGHRPIRWIGHRTVACTAETWPVRIMAGAFGGGLPERELRLSPGHPVLVGADENHRGGHLVPIMCLINGTSIARMPVDSVTYWHLELDAHDILLAEGLPAESFLDYGTRPWFGADAEDHALANPEFVVPGLGARCRPVAVAGTVVEAERCRIDALFAMRLAADCAWPNHDALWASSQ